MTEAILPIVVTGLSFLGGGGFGYLIAQRRTIDVLIDHRDWLRNELMSDEAIIRHLNQLSQQDPDHGR